MSNGNPIAIDIADLSHHYGDWQALHDLSLPIPSGSVFVFLGPNGSGKTTLFRVLSTLVPIQRGRVEMLGFDLATRRREVRSRLGVVFQSPSLDRKLTVAENIRHQAALYGIRGRELRTRQTEMLRQLGLEDRSNELTETLSGGLRRRVELAKGMIHRPSLLLLDEPSTGLDPGARSDLWRYLEQIRREAGVTIVMTTHLLEEAERADCIAILNRGELVVADSPAALRATVGGDSLTIDTESPAKLAAAIRERFNIEAKSVDGNLRLELDDAAAWIGRLMEAFGERVRSITLGKPTLEDVFIEKTGHRFWQPDAEADDGR